MQNGPWTGPFDKKYGTERDKRSLLLKSKSVLPADTEPFLLWWLPVKRLSQVVLCPSSGFRGFV